MPDAQSLTLCPAAAKPVTMQQEGASIGGPGWVSRHLPMPQSPPLHVIELVGRVAVFCPKGLVYFK